MDLVAQMEGFTLVLDGFDSADSHDLEFTVVLEVLLVT